MIRRSSGSIKVAGKPSLGRGSGGVSEVILIFSCPCHLVAVHMYLFVFWFCRSLSLHACAFVFFVGSVVCRIVSCRGSRFRIHF